MLPHARGSRSEVLYGHLEEVRHRLPRRDEVRAGKVEVHRDGPDVHGPGQYQTYARFLPSNIDTTQVFWVKGIVLKAAAEFDRLWASQSSLNSPPRTPYNS
jgi:hypothetical protein